MRKKIFTSPSIFLFLLLINVFVQSCRPDTNNDVIVGESKDEFDEADQILIGDAIDAMIGDPNFGMDILEKNDYQGIYNHLNMMIDQIANTAPVQRRNDFDWKISIINNDDELSAFIIPGGHLYIYTGLLKFLKGEHELVGLIAHEIAYADSNILMDKLKKEFGSKKLSKILSNDPDSQDIIIDISTSIKDIVFSEADIIDADNFCTKIICEFEWDGEGLLSLMKRGGSPLKTIKWFQSRPVTDSRIDNLSNLIFNRSETCGSPDSTYQQRYLETVIEKLP